MSVDERQSQGGGDSTATDGEERLALRRAWELDERVKELEAELVESTERERVGALEVAAAQRDLDVKATYITMLESIAAERQQLIDWLQGQLAGMTDELAHRRALAAEQDVRIETAHAAANAAELVARTTASELAAERARISYRATNRVIRVCQRYGVTRTFVRAFTWPARRRRTAST